MHPFFNEIKCTLSIKESNFNAKNGSKLSHLITARAEGADPSPPLIVSLTVKRPSFFKTPITSGGNEGDGVPATPI